MTLKIVLASGNKGKAREIKDLLKNLPIELVLQSEFNIPEAEETGTTFIENAIIKARHAASLTGLPALADDSGLSVTALDGAPGVYSSRYAGEGATDLDRINKLLDALKDVPDNKRNASFNCVIALIMSANDPVPMVCHGQWHGSILHKPQGENGFGYDPIFYVPDHHCSAAELDSTVKNKISHRGIALNKFTAHLGTGYPDVQNDQIMR